MSKKKKKQKKKCLIDNYPVDYYPKPVDIKENVLLKDDIDWLL